MSLVPSVAILPELLWARRAGWCMVQAIQHALRSCLGLHWWTSLP